MAKKLTGHVHRWIDGVLVSLAPGDPVPDWVTNPALIEDDNEVAVDTNDGEGDTPKGDDLDDLDLDALKLIAAAEEISKRGSADTIRANIRAKRAGEVPVDEDVSSDRDSLIAKAVELGITVDDEFTDAELEVLIASAE